MRVNLNISAYILFALFDHVVLLFPQLSECWVLHSTPEYARDVIARTGFQKPSSETLTQVAEELFQEFQSTKLGIPQAFFMKAHRWLVSNRTYTYALLVSDFVSCMHSFI